MLDIALQGLGDDTAVVTAFFHIHLPSQGELLSNEVARLVLIFQLEDDDWKIVHSGISIPYHHAQDGEVYPIKSLQERNSLLEILVAQRTAALRESEALYRLLSTETLDVVWKTDEHLRIEYISPADERLRGFKADEVIGHSIFEMLTDEGVDVVKDMMRQRQVRAASEAPDGFMTFTVQHRCKDGHLIWGEVLSKPDRNAQGLIVGYHGITREMTQRKLLEEQVRQLAFYDTLTQLANRRLLLDHLALALSASKRSHQLGALLFLDLDKFKQLNDAHGHGVGDLLLVEVAHRLKSCVREIDTVARFGGDEFVVLLGQLSPLRSEAVLQAGAIAEKIRARLSAPYRLKAAQTGPTANTIEHRCSVSIGVALFDGGQANDAGIVDRADAAMYKAKEDGRNLIRFHHDPSPGA
jgi:diguanylate cyclase (GGDEF)-like protein/PAS domain S-box-containing protein